MQSDTMSIGVSGNNEAISRRSIMEQYGACKSYIKYPRPTALRPLAFQPWKVADLCKAYNFPTGLTGGGVIGILELDGGWKQSDLDDFAHRNGLPKFTVQDISVGSSNSPGNAADGEVLLDIEVSVAAYFYATGKIPIVKMFWAPNEFGSFEAIVNKAVEEGCDVLSISWGADESLWERANPGGALRLDQAVQAAAQRGLTVFAASGDNSSSDGTQSANVDMPSGCPHIVGCGGTAKTSASEVVWGNGRPNGSGTGGGFSKVFPVQPWQLHAPQGNGRMVPDVSANAEPDTGYLVVINGQESPVGGTSAVAPLYSGLFAAFGKKLGFVTPTLWKHPGAFTDITIGSNGDYRAAIGPDPCTGLGVPKGKDIASLFVHSNSNDSGSTPTSGSAATNADATATSVAPTLLEGKANNDSVRPLSLGAGSFTTFWTWRGNGLIHDLNFTHASINANSRVFVSMSEFNSDAQINRFVGDARMSVYNVAPYNGGFKAKVEVAWSNPINVRFDVLIDP